MFSLTIIDPIYIFALGGSAKKYNGINSYCPREIPPWQKEITNFFHPKHPGETSKFSNEEQTASSSVNSAH